MDLKGAEIRNIRDLCMDIGSKNSVSLKINIPYYQRPYKWKKEQIDNLINDFCKNKQENQQVEYFVGSVVLVKNAHGSERHDIIDGQQRITTVFLMNYLKYITLRAYIEELLLIRRTSVDSYLKDFEDCYGHLFGNVKNNEYEKMREQIVESLDTINDLTTEEREKVYSDVQKKFQNTVGLPVKDLSDLKKYQHEYEGLLKNAFITEEFALKYSRESYNEKLKEALAKVMVLVSKDKNPEIVITSNSEDKIVEQYTDALSAEFEKIKETVYERDITPLELAKRMINAIDEMINNVKFCVIMTGNEKDAYTLFEVLNDRALEIADLDLIKNLYYKEYCTKSGDSDKVVDKNIEQLDDIWGNEIFTRNLSLGHEKLISYLGTIYLTADEDVFMNKAERYRNILEKKYFSVKYDKNNVPYKFTNVVNDIRVYQMIKIIIDEFGLPLNNSAVAVINAECNVQKSITYKVFHLLNALKLDGVMPALTNVIIKQFFEEQVAEGHQVDISQFKEYIKAIANDYQHNCNGGEFTEIHKWSFEIWRTVLYAKDYMIPRELAKDIIAKVNYSKSELNNVTISHQLMTNMQEQLVKWTDDWTYGQKMSDIKVKVLLINLFKTNKLDKKLTLNPAVYTFKTDKLQLDHLEADKPSDTGREKYFVPTDPNEKREKYVNGLGNFMILDSNDNNNKDNKPLSDALKFYDHMCPNHWLIEEIKELLKNDKYHKSVSIANGEYSVPNEEFFNERKARLQRYFKAVLSRSLDGEEMYLS